jgi:hypothetical protein
LEISNTGIIIVYNAIITSLYAIKITADFFGDGTAGAEAAVNVAGGERLTRLDFLGDRC